MIELTSHQLNFACIIVGFLDFSSVQISSQISGLIDVYSVVRQDQGRGPTRGTRQKLSAECGEPGRGDKCEVSGRVCELNISINGRAWVGLVIRSQSHLTSVLRVEIRSDGILQVLRY